MTGRHLAQWLGEQGVWGVHAWEWVVVVAVVGGRLVWIAGQGEGRA